jgi:hypothetical protein
MYKNVLIMKGVVSYYENLHQEKDLTIEQIESAYVDLPITLKTNYSGATCTVNGRDVDT